MNSLNSMVNSVMDEYRQAVGIEEADLPMNPAFERWIFDACQLGLTPEHMRVVVAERLTFNRSNQCKKGVELKHLVRTDEDVAVVLNEYAVWKARHRIRVMDPNRAAVLRQTHRPDAMPQEEAKPVADVKLIQDLRKAAS